MLYACYIFCCSPVTNIAVFLVTGYKYFLDIISPNNDFKDKLLSLFAAFPEIDLNAMGFNAKWEAEPLWSSPAK